MKLSKLYYFFVGHRTRANYWSCSDFSDWIQKRTGITEKPSATTMDGWRVWHKENEGKFWYWFTEEGLSMVQDTVYFIPDIYYNIKYYIKNRFINKPHYLDTKLKRGEYIEISRRIIYGLFETLVDFIEDEKSYMQQISEEWEKDGEKRRWRKRTTTKRSREYGLKYLDWEIAISNEMSQQSDNAREIKELYLWWKDVRPLRRDPSDESGWSAHCSKSDNIFETNKKDEVETKRLLDLYAKLEQQHEDEDTEMLIRLMKIRKSLWT